VTPGARTIRPLTGVVLNGEGRLFVNTQQALYRQAMSLVAMPQYPFRAAAQPGVPWPAGAIAVLFASHICRNLPRVLRSEQNKWTMAKRERANSAIPICNPMEASNFRSGFRRGKILFQLQWRRSTAKWAFTKDISRISFCRDSFDGTMAGTLFGHLTMSRGTR